MDAEFWRQRWESNQIGFHEGAANAMLVAHFHQLSLAADGRVFVPLCGKTRDIAWLLATGRRVVGVELSARAVDQLFDDLGVAPAITPVNDMIRYSAAGVDVFVGDIFNLTAEMVGMIDAVYDRAALVALPLGMRDAYAAHVAAIAPEAAQLVICFEYDQTAMQGPPFSVDAAEVARVHGGVYNLKLIDDAEVAGGLKGVCPARETVWLLRRGQ